jgi:vacuolar-type H+-ATPase subunit F/Vma7
MSACAIYLGDEVSAAGYRLAGVDTVVPERGAEARAFGEAVDRATLLLVSAAVAQEIPQASLHAAQARMLPLVLIVPDLAGNAPLPDIAHALRTQLGLEA